MSMERSKGDSGMVDWIAMFVAVMMVGIVMVMGMFGGGAASLAESLAVTLEHSAEAIAKLPLNAQATYR